MGNKELPQDTNESKFKRFMRGLKNSLDQAGKGFEESNKYPEKMAMGVIPFDEANKAADEERRSRSDNRENNNPQLPEPEKD